MDSFKVLDETGQVEVRRWINAESPAQDNFQQNDYVRVVGVIKQFGQKVSIMAHGLN